MIIRPNIEKTLKLPYNLAAYVNRTMLMIILWCIVYTVAVHSFGLTPISEYIK
jgi:hypothetical protein